MSVYFSFREININSKKKMDNEDDFSWILCKEIDSAQSLQKVKTTIKTLISNCEYLENYEQHNRLLEAQARN